MKRFLIVSGLGIAVILILLTTLRAQDQKKEGTPAQPAPATEGDVAYTFKDDADVQQFQQLVQARQIVNTRIAVLQSYLAQEAGTLQQVNGQLSLNYKIDPNKNYTMDPQGRVIRELPPQPAQAGTGAQPPAATPQ